MSICQKYGTKEVIEFIEIIYLNEGAGMKKYTKPTISLDTGLAEGIYAASGCYTASAKIIQTIEHEKKYVIQVNAHHNADHSSSSQILVISFNQNVTHLNGGTLISGNGTSTLTIQYNYYQNPNDNIGLSDLTVQSDSGLEIVSVSISD